MIKSRKMNLKKNFIGHKKLQKPVLRFIIIAFSACFMSCSLEYYKSQNSEDSIPEFVFNEAKFSRYEAGKSKIRLHAEKIEQYKSDIAAYAKNAKFDSYDDTEKIETSGICGLLEAKIRTENYKLFNNIYLNMISQKMELNAQSLAFSKKSEQITSGYDSEVKLKKEGLEVSGTGFSASGVSKAFTFDYGVSGTIETNETENSGGKEHTGDEKISGPSSELFAHGE